jgi:hypothetical protein
VHDTSELLRLFWEIIRLSNRRLPVMNIFTGFRFDSRLGAPSESHSNGSKIWKYGNSSRQNDLVRVTALEAWAEKGFSSFLPILNSVYRYRYRYALTSDGVRRFDRRACAHFMTNCEDYIRPLCPLPFAFSTLVYRPAPPVNLKLPVPHLTPRSKVDTSDLP